MKARLEIEFESLSELKAYIDQTTQQLTVAAVAPPLPTPEPVLPPQPESVTPPPIPAPMPAPTTPPAPTSEPTESTQELVNAPAVSTVASSYALDDLARAGAELVRLGKQPELPGILAKYGISSLPELPKERYSEFAADLRELGASI